jgi:hypothetical protein
MTPPGRLCRRTSTAPSSRPHHSPDVGRIGLRDRSSVCLACCLVSIALRETIDLRMKKSIGTETQLVRRGFILEYTTLAWNVVGIFVLAAAAIRARSVALSGFGLDSLIEIGASTVVIWELSNSNEERQRRALRLIGTAFVLLATFVGGQVLMSSRVHADVSVGAGR